MGHVVQLGRIPSAVSVGGGRISNGSSTRGSPFAIRSTGETCGSEAKAKQEVGARSSTSLVPR